MKRIIICTDGTWNAPEINNPKKNRPTNVLKFCRAILPYNGVPQIVFYVRGPGTGGIVDRAAGGLTGYGVTRNVQEAYQHIVHNYEYGDEIFLFGFSRGAYIARSLSGLINQVGLLKKEKMHRFTDVFDAYQKTPGTEPLSGFKEICVTITQLEGRPVPIHFLGVWDTVGALGAPTPLLKLATRRFVSVHYTDLASNVSHACHALATHEVRRHFAPDLWLKAAPNQYVKQVWFPGAHSDVGGGLEQPGLSDIAFEWMAAEAANVGLAFNPDYIANALATNPYQTPNKSRTGAYCAVPPKSRDIGGAAIAQFKHESLGQNVSTRKRYSRWRILARFLARTLTKAEYSALNLGLVPPPGKRFP